MISDKNTNRNKKRITQKFVDRCLANSQAWIDSSKHYESEQLFLPLLQAAIERTSIEDICQSSYKLPSPDTVMAMLAQTHLGSSMEEVESLISGLMQQQVRQHLMFKGFKEPKVILALDIHDEEYYGKPLYDGTKRLDWYSASKHRNALHYATLSIVCANKQWDYPLTIAFAINYLGQERVDLVKRLLQLVNLQMEIDLLLMDGGFNSKDLFEWLDKQNITFICRGRVSKKTKYPDKIGSHFEYVSAGYPCQAYFFSRRKKNKHLDFVLLLSNKNFTLVRAKLLYKKRFRIENTYRQSKIVKMRTSTTKIQLRWIMWAFAHFLELVWELIRYIYQIMGWDSYMIRQKEFLRLVNNWLRLTPQPN